MSAAAAMSSSHPAGAPRERSRRRFAALGAVVLALAVPAIALAHPLGNFTINHFAGIRIAPDRIALDVVIDRAEIPAFQELQRLGADSTGALAPARIDAERSSACLALASDLSLAVDGAALRPALVATGLTLPPGAGGLPTMRLVCEYEAILAAPITTSVSVAFEDRSFAERIGWREIVVAGDGVTLVGATETRDQGGISDRLTSYPDDLLAQPLDMRSTSVSVAIGGPALPAWTAPDAQPIAGATTGSSGSGAAAPGPVAVVPGGIGEDLAALIDTQDLTPIVVLASLAIAFGLGIVHALSPGHGKTIMAAYLVGGRGSSRQAVGLGLAVTVSHTLGVLALAGITLAASSVLPPEDLYPILGVASGGLVIAIGASLLWTRLRALGLGHGHPHPHGHEHPHSDDLAAELSATGHGHQHGSSDPHGHPDAHGHEHGHGHDDGHPHAGDSISWRGLIALGLSGGLVPSASALILLLGSIAAGRAAYGLLLVLGFGLGMAVVLAGIGLLLVHARRLVERRPSAARLRGIVVPVQLATACLVIVLGVVLTGQALTQVL